MALVDIQNKIINDAQKEADKIMAEAGKQQSATLAEAKSNLAKQKKAFAKELQLKKQVALEQGQLLIDLQEKQEVLAIKRLLLQRCIEEVKAQILGDTNLLAKYFEKILQKVGTDFTQVTVRHAKGSTVALAQALKSLSVKPKLVEEDDTLPEGGLNVLSGNSLIDLSLGLYVKEETKSLEKELVDILFG